MRTFELLTHSKELGKTI